MCVLVYVCGVNERVYVKNKARGDRSESNHSQTCLQLIGQGNTNTPNQVLPPHLVSLHSLPSSSTHR